MGIFVLTAQEESSTELRDTKLEVSDSAETSFFEPSETLIKNIIKNALDVRFDSETATYKIADLDHKGGPELIIGAVDRNTATIQVLSIKNRAGDWDRIGRIEYQEMLQGVPEVKELVDITGDGQDEIIMSLMYGGAASWTEGILAANFAEKYVGWILMQKLGERGEGDVGLGPAIFTLAASVPHQSTYQIEDIDKDGKKEIVEIFAQTLFDQTECEVFSYEWDNTVFAFDKTLSEQTLQRLGENCAM